MSSRFAQLCFFSASFDVKRDSRLVWKYLNPSVNSPPAPAILRPTARHWTWIYVQVGCDAEPREESRGWSQWREHRLSRKLREAKKSHEEQKRDERTLPSILSCLVIASKHLQLLPLLSFLAAVEMMQSNQREETQHRQEQTHTQMKITIIERKQCKDPMKAPMKHADTHIR